MPKKPPTEARQLLRELGLRATPARIAVCQILSAADGPLTHADVAERLGDRGIDRTTVFRNLIDLCEAGLARRLEVGDHVYRFEWRTPAAAGGDHPHFVCVDCGEVQCLKTVTPMPIPAARRRDEHIHDVTEVLYKGHCSQCGS